MKILVTAGGTCEDIDSVRSIINHSTGRLGSIIADVFADNNAEVTYLCGERAILPVSDNIEIVRIRDVQSLLEAMDSLFTAYKFDCVIHAMAVSDFRPKTVLTVDDIVESVCRAIDNKSDIKAAILSAAGGLRENKISSKNSDLMILLEKNPKVIGLIKEKQPETILVGFKLLSGASEGELLQAAKTLQEKNACDLVLANDLQDIEGESHEAMLTHNGEVLNRASTKQEIARMIYKSVDELAFKRRRL